MTKEKVVIGFPHGGKTDAGFTQSLLRLQKFEIMYQNPAYELLDIIDEGSVYVSENRNTLVRKAKAMGADWLFQIDPDETFDPSLLRVAMRTANKDTRPIIVGLYSNIGEIDENGGAVIVDCLYREVQDGSYINVVPSSETEPAMVDAAGTGLFLTHLSVFDKIYYPWFLETYIIPTGGRLQFMNEDIAFCRKLREAGFEIWFDPLAWATHWKTMPLHPSLLRKILTMAQKFKNELETKEKRWFNDEIPGWSTEEECDWLYGTASKCTSVVEIGSWMGRSTYSLLKGCKGLVFAVDHFNGSPSEIDTNHAEAKEKNIYDIFMSNVGHFPNLRVMKEDSLSASSKFQDRSIEMVFIDGEHTEEAFRLDLGSWLRKCSKIICGHDSGIEGVEKVLHQSGLPFKSGPGSIWYMEV